MPSSRSSGYVDIHSHILYGMDDGAKTRADSLAMLELAAQSGTTDIVATPHANSRYPYQPDLIDQQIADLNAAASGIRIHRGCDFHLQMDNIQDAVANPHKYSINGCGYLMVEFPDILMYRDVDGILGHLLEAGLVPIITHPERNRFLHLRLNDLARWVDTGCYLQVTAGSITGTFGKPAQQFAQDLLRRGLVHVVASDAHDCKHRPPTLTAAFEALSREYEPEAVGPLFVDNPRAVINGESIESGVVPPRRRSRWSRLFTRGT